MKHTTVYIPVFLSESVDQLLVKEVCAGLEEEGVPFACKQISDEGFSFTSLQVSILIRNEHAISIFHEKLPNRPYLIERKQNGRRAGQNAARLVKGLPLFLEEEYDDRTEFRDSKKND